ncbi:beta-1,3-galactosyltransferase 1-like isoform X2 [Biomphalaria glabrata]|nr:beta-1,3-galactosyltransferase 1-like isoform X2 [Biomphalaria glabrata]XP_013068031.2 beta-1,3-galactosyltransferase 1-like isoform X2 [Biomphalaria glabrata]XP_055882743.1 beta-1,3-galactosyltransferase 1-like isoform X2 [Biomphalaria glabrata]
MIFSSRCTRKIRCILLIVAIFFLISFVIDLFQNKKDGGPGPLDTNIALQNLDISEVRKTEMRLYKIDESSLFAPKLNNSKSDNILSLLVESPKNGKVDKEMASNLISSKPIINPHLYEYRIYPRKNCQNHDITLVMGVTVSRDKFESRQAIRDTWGSYAKVASNKAVLVFFIGSESDAVPSEVQKRIDEEARIHGDILQESYVDHYKNLSLKSVSLLKWASQHCPQSDFLLKSDDDMYVNVPLLLKTLNTTAASPGGGKLFIIGRLHKSVEPIRYTRSKYYTSENIYNQTVFPLYVSGTSYAMTTSAAALLYETTLRVPLFWLEDVYVTGICGKLAGVPIINTYMFPYKRPDPTGCGLRWSVSGHKYTPEQMRTIHSELYDATIRCDHVER